MSRIKKSVLIAVLVGLSGVSIAGLWLHFRAPKNFAEVDPGILYRSSQPTARDLEWMRERYGIRTIVDLCVEKRDTWQAIEERKYALEHGIRIVHLPLPGGGGEASEYIRRFIEVMDDPGNRPVLLHCWKGVKRTGTMVAIYCKEYWKYDDRQALHVLDRFGKTEENFAPYEIKTIVNYQPRKGR